jgi:hypothetical protein
MRVWAQPDRKTIAASMGTRVRPSVARGEEDHSANRTLTPAIEHRRHYKLTFNRVRVSFSESLLGSIL